ncbi:hypothetical protein [Actinoplanes derwentensis]|uniref:hypothetical protein n=1 Tax=Actinoplanes derwentensis TaxID=113562 RepID=UPI001E50AF42|nr:hypothetical protein [Actinoplanes derwentensis]
MAVLAGAGPATAAPEPQLPECAPGRASTTAPVAPAGLSSPRACRADHPLESTKIAFTPSGYHHLGAVTSGEWGGVSGRFSVVDGGIRAQTYDFIVGRFMAKKDLGAGRITWLEAGWAETGWASPGRQHVYTFNTNTNRWQFYDQYAVRPGDQVWLDISGDRTGMWRAWLWWDNRWNLLTQQRLPLGGSAQIEQYVEVHVDATRPARLDMPKVTVDNVQVRPVGGGPARYWREDIATLTGTTPGEQQRRGGFCLDWQTRYDTWSAGNCAD